MLKKKIDLRKLLIKLVFMILPVADVFLFPFVYPGAFFLKCIRIAGVQRLPLCRKALLHVGVFPIRNHYYEPLFDTRNMKSSLALDRFLPGIDWNIEGQIELLNKFESQNEINSISNSKIDDLTFYIGNGAFESGDFEYWYNLIRLKKPKKIFEIGSGYSTLIAIKAIEKNQMEDQEYYCKHICIEPYQMPWLELTGIKVIRKKVEDVNVDFFSELGGDDILFIDSSHVIRPQGDVLFEYLDLLPRLNKGVIVHIHDIFSPKDYLDSWVSNEIKFWNEQYLLEAFLTSNRDWKIIGALNYLHHHHYDKLKDKCWYLIPEREPGSFYIQKIT